MQIGHPPTGRAGEGRCAKELQILHQTNEVGSLHLRKPDHDNLAGLLGR